MSTNTDQISPDDAALWLYAAGELPADRAGPLRQRLNAADAAADRLRAALDEALAGESAAEQVLSRLDQIDGAVEGRAVEGRAVEGRAVEGRAVEGEAHRRAAELARRAVRQWAAGRATSRPIPMPAAAGRGWWTYPLGAAAAGFLGFLIWWGHHDPAPAGPIGATASAEGSQNGLQGDPGPIPLAPPGGPRDGGMSPADRRAERMKYELARRAQMQLAAARAVRQAWEYGQAKVGTTVASLSTVGTRFGGFGGRSGVGGAGGPAGGGADVWANPFATPASLGLPPLEAEGDLEALRRLRDFTSDADLFGGA